MDHGANGSVRRTVSCDSIGVRHPGRSGLTTIVRQHTTTESFRIYCRSFNKPPTEQVLRTWLALYNVVPRESLTAICAAVSLKRLTLPHDTKEVEFLESLTDEDLFGPNTESEDDMDKKTRNRSAHKAPGAKMITDINPKTAHGKIVEYILSRKSVQVTAVEEHFMLDKHAIMSKLNTTAHNTGIGYDVKDGTVTVLLPAGVNDPFEL